MKINSNVTKLVALETGLNWSWFTLDYVLVFTFYKTRGLYYKELLDHFKKIETYFFNYKMVFFLVFGTLLDELSFSGLAVYKQI